MNVALIPARGGSKGLPGKNKRSLLGVPLIEYTLRASVNSDNLDRIIVSSDDLDILKISLNYGVETHQRDEEISRDDSSVIELVGELVKKEIIFPNDTLILLQPTSPLRTSLHIDRGIESFVESDSKSLVSVQRVKHSCYPEKLMQKKSGKLVGNTSIKSRQELSVTYFARNGALYIGKVHDILSTGTFINDPCIGYEMSFKESIDIDTIEDFELAIQLLK